MKINLEKQTAIALSYFLVVTLLGLLLRAFFVFQLPRGFNFTYLLHAHSHTALLGWIYLGLTLLIYKVFFEGRIKKKSFQWIFILTNISILGMLFSFPFQGYALYSISFSSLYLIASYVFTGFMVRQAPARLLSKKSWIVLQTALFYLVLSSLGTWGVGPISAMLGTSSFWFNDALYFFLHFLYSGFFFVSLIGILFYLLEKKGVHFKNKEFYPFYRYLNTGIFLSYFLSVLWTQPPAIFYVLGGIGAVYQLYGYYLLYRLIRPHFLLLQKELGAYAYKILQIAGVLLGFRILLQLFSVIPYIAELAFRFRDFIIGYLHLVFLGIIIPVLLVFLHYFKLLRLSQRALNLFLFTVAVTELMIFYRATAFWLNLPLMDIATFNELLFGFSVLFPVAAGWLLVYNRKTKVVSAPSKK